MCVGRFTNFDKYIVVHKTAQTTHLLNKSRKRCFRCLQVLLRQTNAFNSFRASCILCSNVLSSTKNKWSG